MAVEGESDLKLEIAHVLTMDVVAYSTLLIHEQSRLMADLIKIVRSSPYFREAEEAGKLVRLPTGDGMALVFFTDSEGPLECALQISAGLKSFSQIQLRMGIHSGPINKVLDVNDRANVAGAGIDMAQRVMDCGDAGHILLSKRVADDLAPYPRWNRHLHDLGEHEVKHGRKISVVNFYTDVAGNSEVPQKLKKLRLEVLPKRPRGSGGLRRALWAGSPALLALCAAGWWLLQPPKIAARSVAVMPFLDLSPAKDQEYFSDGITEQIINSLGKIRGLSVMARSSSFVFKNKSRDIREIGKLLPVTHVVEGSVSRGAGRVRVDAHLVDVKNGFRLWGESYDSTEQDALSVQSDVAQKVANALEVQLQFRETTQIAKLPTQDPEANDLYLRGRYLLNKRTPDAIQRALALFREAVEKDPRFALGKVGIADSYMFLGKVGSIPGGDAAALARPEISSALEIDDQLADAYASRGILRTDFEWDWPAAEADYKRALALDPSSAAAHHWYARHLAQIGRSNEALAEIAAAQKQDPLSPTIRVSKGKIQSVARHYDKAIAPCLEALELEPNFASAYQILLQAYAHRGEHQKAIEAAKKYVELSGVTGWSMLELAYTHAVAGDRAESDRIVRDVTIRPGEFSPYDMATIASAVGDLAGAVGWLEHAIAQRSVDVIWIRVDPRLDQVRSASGFQRLVEKLNSDRGIP